MDIKTSGKISIITLIAAIILFVGAAGYFALFKKDNRSGLLKVCPDHWIDNQMPKIMPESREKTVPSQYFIINNKRRELKEFNMDWIGKNCDIEPLIAR